MRCMLVVLVACGGASPPPRLANRSEPARLTCDDGAIDQLRGVLERRWRVPDLQLRCAAGRFDAAGYFLEATAGKLRKTGIVDPSGAVLVPFVDEPAPAPGMEVLRYDAADLDGDGEDEIVETWRKRSTDMPADSWLEVRVVEHHAFRRIRGPYLSRYHPELGGCSASWWLRGSSIRIAVDVKPGIPPTDCLRAGVHTFALRGNALVDATRPHR